MTMTASSEALPTASDQLAQVEHDKTTRLFSLIFIVGGIGTGIASLFDSGSGLFTPWDNCLTTITSALYVISGLIIRLRPKWLVGAILLSLVPSSIYQQGVMYFAVHHPDTASLYSASSSGPFFPLMYVVLFITLPRGASLLSWTHCAGFYVQFVSGAFWPSEQLPGTGRLEGEHLLVEVMMAHPVYILSLNYIVRLRERLHAARAEIFTQKESFLGMLSHEIRNQMQTMVGAIDFLDFKLKDSAEHRSVLRLQGAMERLQTYLGDIKELTKLENPALSIEKRRFDLVPLLDDIRDEWSQHARNRKLELTVSIRDAAQDRSMPVDTDETRLRQIISNLVSNAIKYTETGGVVISAGACPESPAYFNVEVTDTGIGIEERFLDKIYLPHVRLASAAGQHTEGSGLGLAIVKRIVTSLDGTIRVKSQLGVGTSFVVTMPGRAENRQRTGLAG